MTGKNQHLKQMPWESDPTFNGNDFSNSTPQKTGAAEGCGAGYPDTLGQPKHFGNEEWRFSPVEGLPPKPVDLSPSNYVPGLKMPGEGQLSPMCGFPRSVIACPKVAEPGFSGSFDNLVPGKGHAKGVIPWFCKKPSCPNCFPAWMKRAADRAAERLEAARVLYGHRNPRHFSFSPPQAKWSQKLRQDGVKALPGFYRAAYKVFKRAGLTGGVVVFHPWRCTGHGEHRYRTSARYLAPHFHYIGFGYTTNSALFEAKTKWVIRNHDNRQCRKCKAPAAPGMFKCGRCNEHLPPPDSQRKRIYYLLDHCGIDFSQKRAKDAVRWHKDLARVKVLSKEDLLELGIRAEDLVKETPVRCPCGLQCWEYEAPHNDDTPGSPEAPAVEHVECRVYARWKNAKAPDGCPGLYFSLSWGEDSYKTGVVSIDSSGLSAVPVVSGLSAYD